MPFDILTGPEIWRVAQPNHPLIDGVLWEGDVVMLLGSEKAGKSILGLQMAFCLTTATPFLDKYAIPKPQSVLYIQTEGKESEMVERMQHMRQAIALDEPGFSRIFYHFLTLDEAPTMNALIAGIQQMVFPPRVVIIDSLYTSMIGDLNENQAIRQFIGSVSELLKQLGATLVIIHHETKEHWEGGVVIDKGDRASYGSVFLRAWVSHILYLKKHKDKSRTLTCDTQRSGKVMEREELVLIEPEPLCFQIRGSYPPGTAKMLLLFQREPDKGFTKEEVIQRTSLALRTVESGLQQLIETSMVTSSNTRPNLYQLRTIDGAPTSAADGCLV